jgi:hypothetical protein
LCLANTFAGPNHPNVRIYFSQCDLIKLAE